MLWDMRGLQTLRARFDSVMGCQTIASSESRGSGFDPVSVGALPTGAANAASWSSRSGSDPVNVSATLTAVATFFHASELSILTTGVSSPVLLSPEPLGNLWLLFFRTETATYE